VPKKQPSAVTRQRSAKKQSAVSNQPSAKTAKPRKVVRSKPVTAASRNSKPETRNSTDPVRVAEILKRLDATYGGATCALHHKNAWELLVATILSAQCTDVRVNMTTPELFRQYPDAAHLATAKPEEIEPIIKSTGFFRNKSKSIVGAAKAVTENFGGEVPNDMEQLLSLPGVARKTANVVLGTWFKRNEGVVVDTHVHRISRRLELTKSDNARDIEQDLMRVIPREKWTDFSHQVIWHGRALCIARKPKCAACPLENICHAADKTWSTVEIHKSAKP
jgi:endonuclease-3